MNIWVDADACPNVIKEILFRLADRAKVMVTLVANQALSIPESSYIRAMQVMQGFDCLLYTSPSPRDKRQSRMPSSA